MSTTPFFAPSYFASAYFGQFFVTLPEPESQVVTPPANPVETDPLLVILNRLEYSREFGFVALGGPGDAFGALREATPCAWIVPRGWTESDEFDPDLALHLVDFDVVIRVADAEPATRIAELARLTKVACRLLDHFDLGGASLPAMTRIAKAEFADKARHPENEIRLKGQFGLLIDRGESR